MTFFSPTFTFFFLFASPLQISQARTKAYPFSIPVNQASLSVPLDIFFNMGTGMFSYTTFEDQQNEPHFLDACFLCRKPLGNNSDIFMYRGNTPFCSKDCREEQINCDRAKEKSWKMSSSSSSRGAIRKSDPNKNSSTPNKSVRTGTVAVV